MNDATGSNETMMNAPDRKWQTLLGSTRDGCNAHVAG